MHHCQMLKIREKTFINDIGFALLALSLLPKCWNFAAMYSLESG